MINYRKIKEIISQNPDVTDFGRYGKGVSDEVISCAESRLGFSLPNSYKWWLKNYSGNTVHGYEIYRVHDGDVVHNDIVSVYESLNAYLELERCCILPLCVTDDEFFCFLVGMDVRNNEYYVYEAYSRSIYANDFADFLVKFIMD